MSPSQYQTLVTVSNESEADLHLHLELLGEEVVLSPGHSIDLLAKASPALLPLAIHYVAGGLQIYPNKEFDPDWHVRFKGKIIKTGHPTILAEHE